MRLTGLQGRCLLSSRAATPCQPSPFFRSRYMLPTISRSTQAKGNAEKWTVTNSAIIILFFLKSLYICNASRTSRQASQSWESLPDTSRFFCIYRLIGGRVWSHSQDGCFSQPSPLKQIIFHKHSRYIPASPTQSPVPTHASHYSPFCAGFPPGRYCQTKVRTCR